MNSRLRTENATIFDVCCMVKYGTRTSELSSEIKVLYPLEFSDDSVLRSIKQFCFPYQDSKSGENEAVQLFTFVFTDSQSLHTFGYCRFTPRTNSCLCILSGYFWVNLFYNLLNHISTVFTNASLSDVESLLTNAYHMDIPTPGSKLKLNACTAIARFSDKIPDLSCLPTLGEDKFLLEYFNAINERQMIQLYSSLLKERRIIFTASKLNQLSSCIFGLYKLFYPFHWQNLFIPILPKDLTEMLMAPMPFLIGIPKQLFLEMNQTELGDVVIMDLDEKVLTSPYQDKLPMDVYNFLRNRLKRLSDVFLTDSFARSFLQTNVLLFGNYTSGFVKDSSATYSWDREKFVENSRQNIRPYLQSLIGTEGVQYFERFIEERLHALNNDNVIIDEFEKEIQLMGIHRFHGGVLSKPPEFFQQAVSSVKGNAFDVFGALKDQFQSISVKEKSSTMIRPSEKETTHRRHRPLSSNGRSKAKIKAIDPLSIDTSQFNFEHPTLASDPQMSDAASVHSVDDLIDLKDDEPSSSLHPHPSLSKNIYSSPNLQQSATTSINNSTLKPIVHELGFTNVASQLVHPSNRNPAIVKQRNKWQTFE